MVNIVNEIKAEQAVEKFKGGEKVILCEYRLGKAERINSPSVRVLVESMWERRVKGQGSIWRSI
jgi:hypothetical protein